jgi:signal transduction histidine kinase
MAGIIYLFMTSATLAFKGSMKGKIFLISFSFFFVGVTWRYLRNIGYIEAGFWNDNSYQLGAFVHMLVMSVGIFASYSQMRREKLIAEENAITEMRLRNDQRDFMDMVSHEFRTPLTIVQASASNLLSDVSLGKEARLRIEKIIRANDRITELMNNYLSKERILLESHQMVLKNSNIIQICNRVAYDIEDAENFKILIHHNDPNILLKCDPDLIYIAVMNLVNNAVRYSPQPNSVSIHLNKQTNKVVIQVRDQGPGIPEDEKELIFKRFFRGRRAQEKSGAGLGLFMVSNIAQRHQGQIKAENLPAGGCEFCLTLPVQASTD